VLRVSTFAFRVDAAFGLEGFERSRHGKGGARKRTRLSLRCVRPWNNHLSDAAQRLRLGRDRKTISRR
jgi:hypothetical protein